MLSKHIKIGTLRSMIWVYLPVVTITAEVSNLAAVVVATIRAAVAAVAAAVVTTIRAAVAAIATVIVATVVLSFYRSEFTKRPGVTFLCSPKT